MDVNRKSFSTNGTFQRQPNSHERILSIVKTQTLVTLQQKVTPEKPCPNV